MHNGNPGTPANVARTDTGVMTPVLPLFTAS